MNERSQYIASDTSAVSVAVFGYGSRIGVNTVNRWGHAESLGTDNPTYPSKKVEDKKTLGKRTNVWGESFHQKTRVWGWSMGLVYT